MSAITSPEAKMSCDICRRPIDELEPFERSEENLPWDDDIAEEKLIKVYREYYPDYPLDLWHCRDCCGRSGTVWEIDEEDGLGRPLTVMERHDLRGDQLRGMIADGLISDT